MDDKDAKMLKQEEANRSAGVRLSLQKLYMHAPRAYNYVRIGGRRRVPINVLLMLFNELQFHSVAQLLIFVTGP